MLFCSQKLCIFYSLNSFSFLKPMKWTQNLPNQKCSTAKLLPSIMTQLQQNRKMQIFRPIMIGTYSLFQVQPPPPPPGCSKRNFWRKIGITSHVNIFEAFQYWLLALQREKSPEIFKLRKGSWHFARNKIFTHCFNIVQEIHLCCEWFILRVSCQFLLLEDFPLFQNRSRKQI